MRGVWGESPQRAVCFCTNRHCSQLEIYLENVAFQATKTRSDKDNTVKELKIVDAIAA
jgi:hypothetical protein